MAALSGAINRESSKRKNLFLAPHCHHLRPFFFFFCESPKASGPRAVHHVTHGASGRTVIHTAVQNCLSTSEEVLQASIANFPKASVKRSGCTSEAKLQLKLTTRRRLKTKLWDEEDGGGGEREMREKESDRERERNNRITPFR